jgi:hypothetical protein
MNLLIFLYDSNVLTTVLVIHATVTEQFHILSFDLWGILCSKSENALRILK